MFSMRSVLILTVSVGNGHNQAAFNISQQFNTSGYVVKTIDFLEAQRYGVNTLLSKAYQKLLIYKPELFRQICKISEADKFDKVKYMLAKINQRAIDRFVQQYQPDLIICTHFFPLGAAAEYKKKYGSPFKLVGIVTDYIVHPIWEIAHVDQYFVAHPSLVKQFRHINCTRPNTIIPSGIPVGADFTPTLRQLGNNKILVMTSGQTDESMSDIIHVIQALPHHIEVTFITGRDIKRQKQLEQLTYGNQQRRVIGFTNQVASLMKSADLLITKPGGLTITEALATATPLLVFSPIPGIEEENARFLEKHNLGYWAQNKAQLSTFITQFLKHPQQRMMISQQMLTLQSAAASNNILHHLTSGLSPESKVAL